MIGIKEIIFLCHFIVNDFTLQTDVKYSIYDESNTKIQKILSIKDTKDVMLNSCIKIGKDSLDKNLDPILAISVGFHESKLFKDIIGDGSIGTMQVIPKYWCKLQSDVDIWDSPSQFLWIPIKPKPDKCRKKRLKPNHYFDTNCKQTYCDKISCQLKVCDLEVSGILALLSNKSKNLKEMLYKYNKGNQCINEKDPIKKANCIKSGYSYADRVLKLYKRFNKAIKL